MGFPIYLGMASPTGECCEQGGVILPVEGQYRKGDTTRKQLCTENFIPTPFTVSLRKLARNANLHENYSSQISSL